MRDLLLAMAEERDLERLLRMIVERLGQHTEVALARVWLVAPGDICAECPRAAHCPTRVPCLHLAASAGRPLRASEDWSRTNGAFRRIPIGAFKVGIAAARAEAVILSDVASEPQIARPAWIASEGIRAFVGQPLCHRGDVLGVLGVFTRAPVDAEAATWLRVVADHAAAAIANARALAEIAQLRARLAEERSALREDGLPGAPLPDILGESAAMGALMARIEQVAPTSATVLVLGESGTGKELVARAIHTRSRRGDRPLVSMSCATVPRELYESELFGHVKGAFTGATRDRLGRFAAADRGTLFLDEVGEIPLDLQSKLLRVLQEGTFERVGDDRTHTVDVRIVAATNRDLAREVAAGRFREDLYYRLAVVPVTTPPLRERKQDIPLLARAFVARVARKLAVPQPRLAEADIAALMDYDWPGNVRELENVIERAVVLCRDNAIDADTLGLVPGDAVGHTQPMFVQALSLPAAEQPAREPAPQPGREQPGREPAREPGAGAGADTADRPARGVWLPGDLTLEEATRAYAEAAVERTAGNRSEAARQLGIGRNRLARLLRGE